MLFLMSLIIGLILGCFIGGMVLLLAKSMSISHPKPLGVPRRQTRPSTNPNLI